MPFNSLDYLIFLTVIFLCSQALPATAVVRSWFLIFASLVFYGSWNVWFVPLLCLTAVVDFYVAGQLVKGPASRRHLWLVGSLGFNLLLIFGFKLGFNLGWVETIPLGLSFYTFQSMAYVLDVYRDVSGPVAFRSYLSSITFFPHLVAGPIVRTNFLIPQFEKIPEVTWPMVRSGMWLISCGLCKKSLADWMGGWVDTAYETEMVSGSQALVASVGFVAQIYGDFSGYTDIARGSARFFGIELPFNFFRPFSAASPMEYYSKRWHVSLATWIHDYLYVPVALFLGRRGVTSLSVAVIATMAMMGVWHGLGWNYVLWGLYVGVVLTVAKTAWTRWPAMLAGPLGVALTFYLVTIGLVVFRSPTWGQVGDILLQLHGGGESVGSLFVIAYVVALVLIMHGLSYLSDGGEPTQEFPWYVGVVVLGAIAFSIGKSGTNFIYFHF